MKFLAHIFPIFLIISCASLPKGEKHKIGKFVSDGCSMFLDGTISNDHVWRECCEYHDFSYWMGGTRIERKNADENLETCVTSKGYPITARLMYLGVRTGGSPKLSTTFRWGYGWNYQREYAPLTSSEKKMILKTITHEQYSKYKEILFCHEVLK